MICSFLDDAYFFDSLNAILQKSTKSTASSESFFDYFFYTRSLNKKMTRSDCIYLVFHKKRPSKWTPNTLKTSLVFPKKTKLFCKKEGLGNRQNF